MSFTKEEQETLDALLLARESEQVREDRERLPLSLKSFVKDAWSSVEPEIPFIDNWHIDAICAHLEACSDGDIQRLQIWVPRASMKSRLVSTLWHAWEWTRNPSLRYFSLSYDLRLSGRLAADSRNLMMKSWYQARWGDTFSFTREGERYYANDHGGTRLATAPGSSALGEHGHRILIDDPINVQDAEADSRIVLEQTNEWYDAVVPGTRLPGFAEVIIMQRLHERDLAAYVLDYAQWTVLCLPERYERDHPYVWRGDRINGTVKGRLKGTDLAAGDPRKEGQLLWPARRDERASNEMAASLKQFRAAGQMQQRPASKEGELLKRNWWRFYDPKWRDETKLYPRFQMVVISVDTPLKDKQSNDFVAIQAWGVTGADRYLLDLRKGKMNYGQAKRAIKEMSQHMRRTFSYCAHYVLIENAGYGPELITELKREIPGVTKISAQAEGDKVMRATAASDVLESGNCWLPGVALGADGTGGPDEGKCPADIVDFINSCAGFPNASHDDDVDAWSQCQNWLRSRQTAPSRTWSSFRQRRR